MPIQEVMQGLIDPETADAFRQVVNAAGVKYDMTTGQFITALLSLLIGETVEAGAPGIQFLRIAFKASLQTFDEVATATSMAPATINTDAPRAERIAETAAEVIKLFRRVHLDSSEGVEVCGCCLLEILHQMPQLRGLVKSLALALVGVCDAN
jgi:hypothetical protein